MKIDYKPIALAALLITQGCAHPNANQQSRETSNLIIQIVDSLKFNPRTIIKRHPCSTQYEWADSANENHFKVEYEVSLKGCPPLLFGEKTLSVSHMDPEGYEKKFIDHNADGLNGVDISSRYRTTAISPAERGYFREFKVERSNHMDDISEEDWQKEREEYEKILKIVSGALMGKGI